MICFIFSLDRKAANGGVSVGWFSKFVGDPGRAHHHRWHHRRGRRVHAQKNAREDAPDRAVKVRECLQATTTDNSISRCDDIYFIQLSTGQVVTVLRMRNWEMPRHLHNLIVQGLFPPGRTSPRHPTFPPPPPPYSRHQPPVIGAAPPCRRSFHQSLALPGGDPWKRTGGRGGLIPRRKAWCAQPSPTRCLNGQATRHRCVLTWIKGGAWLVAHAHFVAAMPLPRHPRDSLSRHHPNAYSWVPGEATGCRPLPPSLIFGSQRRKPRIDKNTTFAPPRLERPITAHRFSHLNVSDSAALARNCLQRPEGVSSFPSKGGSKFPLKSHDGPFPDLSMWSLYQHPPTAPGLTPTTQLLNERRCKM